MKKAKAFLALLLSIIMIVSLIPASEKAKASYMPLEEIYGSVDLSDLTTEQLRAVSVDDILSSIVDVNGNPITIDGNAVAYTFDPHYDYREYTILNGGEKLNLVAYADEFGYDISYRKEIEFICGAAVDQLSLTNKRYIITIITPDTSYTEVPGYLDLTDKYYFELRSISLETLLEGITGNYGGDNSLETSGYTLKPNEENSLKVLAYKLKPYEDSSSIYERDYKVGSVSDKVDLFNYEYYGNIDTYLYLMSCGVL